MTAAAVGHSLRELQSEALVDGIVGSEANAKDLALVVSFLRPLF